MACEVRIRCWSCVLTWLSPFARYRAVLQRRLGALLLDGTDGTWASSSSGGGSGASCSSTDGAAEVPLVIRHGRFLGQGVTCVCVPNCHGACCSPPLVLPPSV